MEALGHRELLSSSVLPRTRITTADDESTMKFNDEVQSTDDPQPYSMQVINKVCHFVRKSKF